MRSEFVWLATSDVISINLEIVTESKEPHLLLDQAKLEAAIMRPQNLYHFQDEENTLTLAVSYMVSIAQAHAFMQGNKRSGFVAGIKFIQDHGYDLLLPDDVAIADLFMEVIMDTSKIAGFETHLEQFIVAS